MKKNGFTLTEVLVTLGIISLLVLLIAPTINNLKPDDHKMNVLKAYNALTNINKELLSDLSIYLGNNCRGLSCTEQPSNARYGAQFVNNMKYPLLVASKLNITDDVGNALPLNFNTADGLNWTIDGEAPNYVITIDVDAEGADCSFGNQCQNPDRYLFNIDEDGTVVGGDALTIAYLRNPYRLRDRNRDILVAGGGQGGEGGQGGQGGQGGEGGQGGQGGQGGEGGQGGQGGQGGEEEENNNNEQLQQLEDDLEYAEAEAAKTEAELLELQAMIEALNAEIELRNGRHLTMADETPIEELEARRDAYLEKKSRGEKYLDEIKANIERLKQLIADLQG